MISTTFETTEDKNIKLQMSKFETILKFYKNKSSYYVELIIRFLEMKKNVFLKMFKVFVKFIMKFF